MIIDCLYRVHYNYYMVDLKLILVVWLASQSLLMQTAVLYINRDRVAAGLQD